LLILLLVAIRFLNLPDTQPATLRILIYGLLLVLTMHFRPYASPGNTGCRKTAFDTDFVFSYVRVMKNITISMPEDLARKVRVLAAKADTSMSQYLCQLAVEKAAEDDSYEASMRSYLARGTRLLRDPAQPLPKREELYDRDALR